MTELDIRTATITWPHFLRLAELHGPTGLSAMPAEDVERFLDLAVPRCKLLVKGTVGPEVEAGPLNLDSLRDFRDGMAIVMAFVEVNYLRFLFDRGNLSDLARPPASPESPPKTE